MTAENDKILNDKIDALNQRAWDIRVNDSPGAFALSQETVALSRRIGYAKGLAEGLRSLGFGYVRMVRNEEAMSALQESLSLFEALNDRKGQAVANEYIGIVQRNRGNFSQSLERLFKALALSEETDFAENVCTNYYQIGVTYKHLGDFDRALDYLYKSLTVAKATDFTLMEAYAINVMGSIYFETADYEKALDYYLRGYAIRHAAGDQWGEAGSLDNIGHTYLKLNDYDRALEYGKKSLDISRNTGDQKGQSNALLHLAEVYKQLADTDQAYRFCNESLQIRKRSGDRRGEAEILLFLADLQDADILERLSAALKITEEIQANDLSSKAHYGLHLYHKRQGDFEKALHHLQEHIRLEKELHVNTVNQKVLNLEISHRAEETKKEAETVRLRNEELTRLNKEIEEQKEKLEQALAELKAAQAQLIQREKMASLGELTAGIAHEIQNPLNFVNNFAEVSAELARELKNETGELSLPQPQKDNIASLVEDLLQNQEKIFHHGQRADNIVKGMLQHSRKSSGEKQPTDINALVNEYLRLAYHGFRTKNNTFHAAVYADFENDALELYAVQQELGQVLLNLFNNAFYAVNERGKQQANGYQPAVWVRTEKKDGKVNITVRDNGTGIPQKVRDKIFQPFFTTKPTGEGTGLGLSLSYDIITKGHGGEMKVRIEEGEFTEFVILLPCENRYPS